MGNTRDTGYLQNIIKSDNLGRIGIGGAVDSNFIANLTGNLRVTGTSQLLGAVTSPTFIGALTGIASGNALVSQIPINNNQLTNGAGYLIAAALTPYALLSGANFSGAIGGTTASFSGTVTANTTLTLLNTTSSTTGVIYKGADRFIHNNGIQSTAIGVESGNFTMTGASNTSVGFTALRDISSGADNTAIGTQALRQNTTGASNTAVGLTALVNNLGGSSNTAIGRGALVLNTSGGANTALGVEALFNATTGENNTSIGRSSGGGITTGSRNTILGANVMGLAAALTNNIILASGDGVIKARHDGTNWTLTGTVTAPTFVGALTGVASGNLALTGGTLTGALTGTLASFSGVLTSTSSQAQAWSGRGTGFQHADAINTSAFLRWGIEGSAGGELLAGSLPYSSVFGTHSNTGLHFNTNSIIRTTILANGNVGIGTTAPTERLDVVGHARFTGNISIFTGQSFRGNNYYNFSAASDRLLSAGFAFGISQSNATGDITIGNTASSAAAETNTSLITRFTIAANGNATFTGNVKGLVYIVPTNANATLGLLCRSGIWRGDSQNNLALAAETGFGISMYTDGSATEKFVITPAGNATFSSSVTATSYITSSDISLKTLTDLTVNPSSIKAVGYKLKADLTERDYYGYIAQEIQEVMPFAVHANEEGILSVDYTQVLVAKVQYLEDKLEVAELRLQALETN